MEEKDFDSTTCRCSFTCMKLIQLTDQVMMEQMLVLLAKETIQEEQSLYLPFNHLPIHMYIHLYLMAVCHEAALILKFGMKLCSD